MRTLATWDDFGRYFGFPECCIRAFNTLAHVGGPPRKLSGTGYIPCLECNEKSEEELVKTINSARLARLPFPKAESHGKTLKHMGEVFGKEFK